jgi:hypothetical protein
MAAELAGEAQQGQGGGRTRAVFRTQTQIQKRTGVQGIEHDSMPALPRDLNEKEPALGAPAEASCSKRRHRSGEAVDQDWKPHVGARHVAAHQRRRTNAAEPPHRLERRIALRTAVIQASLDAMPIAADLWHSRTSHCSRRPREQGTRQSRCVAGVSRADHGADEYPRAAQLGTFGGVPTGVHGARELVAGHRRFTPTRGCIWGAEKRAGAQIDHL